MTKTPEQALATLQSLCSKAERSSGDAMRLMARWGVDAAARSEVLERLVRDRFIDDGRYAAAYVREKSNLGGWGIHKIRAALAAKGIARPTIEEALAQIVPEASQERLETLLQRKIRTVKAKDAWDLRAKLVRYGLGRGFGYEAVTAAVERLVRVEEE